MIDERYNGGGSAADYIVDILGRDYDGYFNNPAGDRVPFTSPASGIWGPKVMTSTRWPARGDLMPYMFKRRKIGPLVGKRTWGGLVATSDTPPFVDGGSMIAPRFGFFARDNKWAVENEGVAPDVDVENWPKDVVAGRDPQLERSVQEAMRLLAANPGDRLMAEPPPPTWGKRVKPQLWRKVDREGRKGREAKPNGHAFASFASFAVHLVHLTARESHLGREKRLLTSGVLRPDTGQVVRHHPDVGHDRDNYSRAEQLMTTAKQARQASLGAVRALRSRVMLYQENWQGALDAATAVQAMNYILVPQFENLFTDEGSDTPEDIFRVSFTAVEFNEVGYYYLFDGRWEVAPTADLYSAYSASDRRRDITLGKDGSDYEGVKIPTTIGAEDLHVIRYGEVVLTKAEALARLNRSRGGGRVNKIRVRAGLTPHVLGTDVTSQTDVLNAIWNEAVRARARGDRWPDLVARAGRCRCSAAGESGVPAVPDPVA